MSKPRWIDGGVFRTLRTATRARKLAVIVGPEHGDAQASSRTALREALGSGDRTSLAEDGRFKSQTDAGLAALYTLRQPGVATTAVSDALLASAPEEEKTRVFGPDSKGLKGAWDRKDGFVTYLRGRAAEPGTLVLTNKDRKPLMASDGRYQAFLRATFSRTVLFTGFRLDDPDLQELLEDVTRCFNGHVPQNIALVPADSTDPAAALRANMHYGMSLVEFPSDQTASQALAEIAHILEDLEIPKPATGNPPRGFTELTAEMRSGVGAPSGDQKQRFADGDSSGWESIQAGLDVRRNLASEIAGLLGGDVTGEKPLVALVRGRAGEGKTVLARRLAWELADGPARVFWRESAADLPDRYVPEDSETARAIFVLDDSHELALLPLLLKSLCTAATAPKARFLLTTEGAAWDRSGLDHRIRQHADVRDFTLEGLAAEEAQALAEALSAAGRLSGGADAAREVIQGTEGVLMDRIAAASGGGSIGQSVAALVGEVSSHGDAERLKRAYLATALVHQHGTSLSRAHLAAFLGVDEASVAAQVLEPLGRALISVGDSAIRTPHPLIASAAVDALAPDEAACDELIIDLLKTLPGGSIADPTVLHAPSELIRMRRQKPLAPLTLGKLFAAGEEAARNDVHFWFDRGRYEADFSRWEEALAAFDQASWRRPGDVAEKEHNAVVQANRARCLQSLGRKREALGAVDEGLRLSPNDAGLVRLREKLGGRRPVRGRGGRGGGGGRGGRGGPGGGRGGPGGGRGGPGGGRGGPGGGRGGPGGGRGGPGGGPGARQGPRRPGDDAPRRGPAQPGQA